ncbi:MAG: diacylglycerol kinase family lipid kinase [Clostridia bacterium]|nr:diacylglycerol kinase family lipid kinase [Clostridia bacterium]
MEEKKLLLIINPVSGRMKMSTAMFEVVKVFSDAGYLVTVRMTRGRGDATKMIRDMGSQYDRVVICGGDGTLNEGVAGLIESGLDLPIGYIPCGTTNDFAASLGLEREDLKRAAERIVNGTPMTIDIGRFNEQRFFSYIASFGAFTGTAYNVPQASKNALGYLAYVLEGFRDLPNIRPIRAQVILDDGKVVEDEFIFASVSNATTIGGVVKLAAEKVNFSDGIFEVILVRYPHSPLEVSKALLALQTGKYEDTCIRFFHARKVLVVMPKAEPWTLDGEYTMGGISTKIEVLHHAIKVMV